MFVALPNAFVFYTKIVVRMAAHEMHGWQSESLVAMAAVVAVKVFRDSLHLTYILPHCVNLLR